MTTSPERPGAWAVFRDGSEMPIDLMYIGEENGVHCWSVPMRMKSMAESLSVSSRSGPMAVPAFWPALEDIREIKVGALPARTSISFPIRSEPE